MMKSKPTLAIYGDSFADPRWVENDYPAWSELLEENFTVTNFSFTGTGMWWSYDKFIETHEKFDTVVFVVTVPGRIHIECKDAHLNLNPATWPVWSGINMGDMYFRYFYSPKREDCFHKFMVDDILKRNNILVVPAFKESIPGHEGWSLCHLADTELAFYDLKHNGWNEKRKCHMTRENNRMVYNKVLEAVDNGSKILNLQESDFVPPADPLTMYWK
jgi:hypothetical protein